MHQPDMEKTFSVFLGALIQYINEHPETYRSKRPHALQLLWISPLRALAKDIGRARRSLAGLRYTLDRGYTKW